MVRYVAILAVAVLSLSCASSGGQTEINPPGGVHAPSGGATPDVQMPLFGPEDPPVCDFEEVGRVQWDTPAWATDGERSLAERRFREEVKHIGGDALLINRQRRLEYIVIRFTDPDCRE